MLPSTPCLPNGTREGGVTKDAVADLKLKICDQDPCLQGQPMKNKITIHMRNGCDLAYEHIQERPHDRWRDLALDLKDDRFAELEKKLKHAQEANKRRADSIRSLNEQRRTLIDQRNEARQECREAQAKVYRLEQLVGELDKLKRSQIERIDTLLGNRDGHLKTIEELARERDEQARRLVELTKQVRESMVVRVVSVSKELCQEVMGRSEIFKDVDPESVATATKTFLGLEQTTLEALVRATAECIYLSTHLDRAKARAEVASEALKERP